MEIPDKTYKAGEWANGKIPVQAGQDYAVFVRLSPKSAGKFAETISVNDGQTTNLKATGRVVSEPTLTCSVEKGDFVMDAGSTRVGTVHVTLDNLTATKISIVPTSLPSWMKVKVYGDNPYPVAKGHTDLHLSFEVKSDASAPNGTGDLTLKISALDGKLVQTVTTSVKLDYVWSMYQGMEGDYKGALCLGHLSFNNHGDAVISTYLGNYDPANSYAIVWALRVEDPLPEGGRLGFIFSGLYSPRVTQKKPNGSIEVVSKNSSESYEFDIDDPRLKLLAGSKIQPYMFSYMV